MDNELWKEILMEALSKRSYLLRKVLPRISLVAFTTILLALLSTLEQSTSGNLPRHDVLVKELSCFHTEHMVSLTINSKHVSTHFEENLTYVQSAYANCEQSLLNIKEMPNSLKASPVFLSETVSFIGESQFLAVYPYTKEDVFLLGDLMYAEEGILLSIIPYDDAKRAHMLAGSVVLNRLDAKCMDYSSIHEVIFSPGYASTTKEKIGNIETPDEVYEWAEELLKYGSIAPKNLVFQAQFIQGEIYDHIYNQYFCLTDLEC